MYAAGALIGACVLHWFLNKNNALPVDRQRLASGDAFAATSAPRPKIFYLASLKCGTTSFRSFMNAHGLSVADEGSAIEERLGVTLDPAKSSVAREKGRDIRGIFEHAVGKNLSALHDLLQDHDVFSGYPWLFLYRVVDRHFPGSKFVFARRDTDRWLQSMVR